jgi:hypothetical protein
MEFVGFCSSGVGALWGKDFYMGCNYGSSWFFLTTIAVCCFFSG